MIALVHRDDDLEALVAVVLILHEVVLEAVRIIVVQTVAPDRLCLVVLVDIQDLIIVVEEDLLLHDRTKIELKRRNR